MNLEHALILKIRIKNDEKTVFVDVLNFDLVFLVKGGCLIRINFRMINFIFRKLIVMIIMNQIGDGDFIMKCTWTKQVL